MSNIIDKLFESKELDELNNMVRWNGAVRIKDETVVQHSFIVALFTRLLAEEIFTDDKIKLEATTFALLHDLDEAMTGDINHVIKYNIKNGDELRNIIDSYVYQKAKESFPPEGTKSDALINQLINKEVSNYIK